MSDWIRIQARSGNKDVWLNVRADNKLEQGQPWLLPDHSDAYRYITDWQPEKIPSRVWLAPYNRGSRYGDMLWTGGLTLKIASTRMIEALAAAGVTGYRTFPVEIRSKDNSPIKDYIGFATDPYSGSDLQNLYDQDVQNYAFVARAHVAEALRERGADALDIEPYDPEAGPPQLDMRPIEFE